MALPPSELLGSASAEARPWLGGIWLSHRRRPGMEVWVSAATVMWVDLREHLQGSNVIFMCVYETSRSKKI